MNTFLSSRQESERQKYRLFASERVYPLAEALERHRVSLKELLQSCAQDGFLGLTVAYEYGGQGKSFLDQILFVEAVSEFAPGLGFTLSAHTTAIELLKRFGSVEQKAKFLPALAKGDKIGSFALSEEAAGTDLSAVQTVCYRQGDKLILSGKKVWVANAEFAGVLIVLTRMRDSSDDGQLALAVVDLAETDKIDISPDRSTLGLRAAYINDVEFTGSELVGDNLLAFQAAETTVEQVRYGLDLSNIQMAATAVGMLSGALNAAADHARQRKQFGKRLGQFQAVQWKLADCSVELDASRLLTYRAAWSADENVADLRKNAAMCKWYATKASRVHVSEAVQILGSAGVSGDSLLERFYRDAKMLEICQGTSELQKIILAEEFAL